MTSIPLVPPKSTQAKSKAELQPFQILTSFFVCLFVCYYSARYHFMCPCQGNMDTEQQGLYQGEEGHRGHASQHLLKLLGVGSHEGLKSLIC